MTVGEGAGREPKCQDCEHEPEYGESISADGKDWCYDCGFSRFEPKKREGGEKR